MCGRGSSRSTARPRDEGLSVPLVALCSSSRSTGATIHASHLDRMLRLIDITEILRSVFAGDETIGQLNGSRVVAVVRRDEQMGAHGRRSDGADPALAGPDRPHRPALDRGPPGTPESAEVLLDELAQLDAQSPAAVGLSAAVVTGFAACADGMPPVASPKTSSRSSRSTGSCPTSRLSADYNVAPTKEVYAVMDRVPRDAPEGTPPERRLTTLTWGLVPSWAKDPQDRVADDQRPARDPDREAGLQARRRQAPVPASGRRLLRVVRDGPDRRRGASRSSSRSSSRPRTARVMAMAGLYEIWRNKEIEDPDAPGAFLWTSTVITTSAEDSLGHIHDRMPMLVEPSSYDAWLDASVTEFEDLAGVLVPAAPGPARRLPGLDRRSTTSATTVPSWSRRCRSSRADGDVRDAVRLVRRPLMHSDVRMIATPQGDARLYAARAQPTGRDAGARPWRRQGRRTPATWRRWPMPCPARASRCSGSSSPGIVAGKKVAARPAAARRGDHRLRQRDPGPHADRARRSQRRGAGRLPAGVVARRGRLRRAGFPAPPAGPARERPGCPSCSEQGFPRSSSRASATRSAARRSSRPRSSSRRSPTPTTASRCRSGRRCPRRRRSP